MATDGCGQVFIGKVVTRMKASHFVIHFANNVKSKKKKVARPKTALPRELAYKKALLRKMGKEEEPIGVNTVKAETKTGMKGVLSSSAPRRK